MFIIPVKIRFAIMALLLVATVVVQIFGGWAWSWLCYVPLIVLAVGYFLFGTIGSASKRLMAGDMLGAERQLGYTYFPKLLLKMNRAIMHVIRGMIAQQSKDLGGAEQHLLTALDLGLPSDQEKAMVNINLANIYASKRKWQQASKHIRNAKEFEPEDAEVKKQIKDLESFIKSKGQTFVKGARKQKAKGGGYNKYF